MLVKRLSIRSLTFPILALALVLVPVAASAQEEGPVDSNVYTIDTAHATIGFKVRHLTVSNVSGKFGTFEGAVRYSPGSPADSEVKVTIDATSIDTDNERRDGHLKSADFLDVENHPTITFESTRIEKNDEGFQVTGGLTMRGVTREVSFPVSVVGPIRDPMGMQRMGIEGGLTIDRRDWGLNWDKTMETGGLIVGNDVKIEISAEVTHG